MSFQNKLKLKIMLQEGRTPRLLEGNPELIYKFSEYKFKWVNVSNYSVKVIMLGFYNLNIVAPPYRLILLGSVYVL